MTAVLGIWGVPARPAAALAVAAQKVRSVYVFDVALRSFAGSTRNTALLLDFHRVLGSGSGFSSRVEAKTPVVGPIAIIFQREIERAGGISG